MPFPSNPFPSSRPFPMPSPRTATGTNIGGGRPAWGDPRGGWNTKPGWNVSPETGGKMTPVNPQNPNNLPSGKSNNLPEGNPRNDYPDKPLEGWNLNPQYNAGRPNRIPTINAYPDVPSPWWYRTPSGTRTPMDDDPLGRPVGEFGRWVGEQLGGAWNAASRRRRRTQTQPEIDVTTPTVVPPGAERFVPQPEGGTNLTSARNGFTGLARIKIERTGGYIYSDTIRGDASDSFENEQIFEVFLTNYRGIYKNTLAASSTGDRFGNYYFSQYAYYYISADNLEFVRWLRTTQFGFPAYQIPGNFGNIGNEQSTYLYEPYLNGYTLNKGWSRVTVSIELLPNVSPDQDPNTWDNTWITPRTDYDINIDFDEEDMNCQPCQAAQALRALQRTITVDSTAITVIPTGNALIGQTIQKPVRVFALPGTEDSIKQQFNLFDDLRKRLARTFNQSRMAKVMSGLNRIMGVADFVLNLHNALMLSEDIVETVITPFTSLADTIIRVIDDTPLIGELYDLGETQPNTREFVGKLFDENMQRIFGVEGWADIKNKWASFNNIVRGAAMQIQAARDIGEAQKDLSEMTASRMGKLHNKLAKAGIFGGSDLWEEKVNRRWAWMYKLEDMADDNRFTNAAQFVNSWGTQVLDIREQKREMEESREKFRSDLQQDLRTITDQKGSEVADSTGATYTRSDTNAPETDNSQGGD